jgi:hypothetical protein
LYLLDADVKKHGSVSSAFPLSASKSKKQKLAVTTGSPDIALAFSNVSAKAQRHEKQQLLSALVKTIIHTPCAMFTVMNPATREFCANLLQVEECNVKMPSYSSVCRAVRMKVDGENENFLSDFRLSLGTDLFWLT